MKVPNILAARIRKGSLVGILCVAAWVVVFPSAASLAQVANESTAPGGNASDGRSEVVWQRDLHLALKEAKTSDKMILIDVYTNWCGPCKMLDKNTYSSPDVVTYLKRKFICVKVNAEDPTLGNWVSAKYGIDAYPSIIVLAANGRIKGKFVGYCDPQRFLSEVNRLAMK